MNLADLTPSGIPAIGDVPWGSHFCHLYGSAGDLADALVPYFKSGLEHNEQCLWVTAPPLGLDDARSVLGAAVPELDRYIASGQMEIIEHQEWYLRQLDEEPNGLLKGWITRKDRAMAAGWRGLRLTGNLFWLDSARWDTFADYEEAVNAAFKGHEILALCSYCQEKCTCNNVLDILRNHDFALVRHNGTWEMIENATLKMAKQELLRLNVELERRVDQRTAELRAALAERELLMQELNHRVKNNLQVISSMLRLQLRVIDDPLARRHFRDALARITVLSVVHTLMHHGEGLVALNVRTLLRRLSDSLLMIYDIEPSQVLVEVEAPPLRVPSDTAVSLSMVMTELLSNSLKHGFPQDRTGCVHVQGSVYGDRFHLTVVDDGEGFDLSEDAGHTLGMQMIQEFARSLGARIDIDSRPGAGTRATLSLPLSTFVSDEEVNTGLSRTA